MNYEIVTLSEDDREAVVRIFNHFIASGFAAYFEKPVPEAFFDRLLAMCKGYPAVVVKADGCETVGFAFLHAFHPAETFRQTAEISYFLLPEHTRKGLGSRILSMLTVQAREMGINNLVASVSSLNEQSLQFHAQAGFERSGALRGIGRKFGQAFDVVWFRKELV